LIEYQLARAFHSELGVSAAELDTWDEDKVQEWATIMEVVTNFEAKMAEQKQAMASRKGG
jgi:hypothetical protein